MRNLLGTIALLALSCTGPNADYDPCADRGVSECQSNGAANSMSDVTDGGSNDATKNCINLAYVCVLYNCTIASEECSRESPLATCLNCIDKSRNGALCKYYITNCLQTCQG